MARELKTGTLDTAAKHYAATFARPTRSHQNRIIDGAQFVVNEFYKFTYMDEFDYLMRQLNEWMGPKARKEFERLASFPKRDEAVFHQMLADKLAIDPDGEHIPNKVGSVQVGSRLIGTHDIEVETPESLRRRKRLGLDKSHRETMWRKAKRVWPIYAGEIAERLAGNPRLDEFPDGTPSMAVGATNTRLSNEVALLACNAVVDNLDEGAGAAVIQGRTGAQPADPDTATSGTLLFTLTCSDPAFGNAADGNPGGVATASSITDDTNADATDTLGYCRASSTADGATPADDHIDGEAGTSGADFNFNTLAIVTGATVSLTAWTVTMPES